MILISVAYALPDRQVEIELPVEESCTVALAIQRSGILQQFPEIRLNKVKVGINSRKVPLDELVKDRCRIEIYRSLLIDPKQARLQRSLNA